MLDVAGEVSNMMSERWHMNLKKWRSLVALIRGFLWRRSENEEVESLGRICYEKKEEMG